MPQNPKFKALAYKTFGLGEGRLDMDPSQVRKALAKPGNMIMVDDPRIAARELKRGVQRVPVRDDLRAPLPATLSGARGETNAFSPPQFLCALSRRVNPRSLGQLERLLRADFPERTDLAGDVAHQQQRAAHILERAWAAQKIGQLGKKSTRVIRLLERQVQNRSTNSAVRGTAILGCLNDSSRRRTSVLRAVLPWTDDLPRAGYRDY